MTRPLTVAVAAGLGLLVGARIAWSLAGPAEAPEGTLLRAVLLGRAASRA